MSANIDLNFCIGLMLQRAGCEISLFSLLTTHSLLSLRSQEWNDALLDYSKHRKAKTGTEYDLVAISWRLTLSCDLSLCSLATPHR